MSAQPHDGGPAFPETRKIQLPDSYTWTQLTSGGMSLRDWFAGQALAAVIRDHDEWAKTAYRIADAMLAERAKQTREGAE